MFRGLGQTAGGEVLRPMGLCDDEGKYPLSPRSEQAFQHISRQFDALYQKMRHTEVENNGKVSVRFRDKMGAVQGVGEQDVEPAR
jgi:hypothetical protein